jgi:hypothetical protein
MEWYVSYSAYDTDCHVLLEVFKTQNGWTFNAREASADQEDTFHDDERDFPTAEVAQQACEAWLAEWKLTP